MNEAVTPVQTDQDLSTGHIVYALYAASFLVGITGLIGVIIAHIKRGDAAGNPLLASHFKWQIRTFWWGFLWAVIGLATLFFYIGAVILLANTVWFIYRIVRGWLALNDKKPMYC